MVKVAGKGVVGAAQTDPALLLGLSTLQGHLVNEPVAQAHGLAYRKPGRPPARRLNQIVGGTNPVRVAGSAPSSYQRSIPAQVCNSRRRTYRRSVNGNAKPGST